MYTAAELGLGYEDLLLEMYYNENYDYDYYCDEYQEKEYNHEYLNDNNYELPF